jgi:hypothetical protein
MARGRRGRNARVEAIVRDIQQASSQRREARAQHRPNDAARLAADLNGRDHVLRPEGLFADLRDERSGTIPAGRRQAGPTPEDRPGRNGGMAR